MQNRGDFQNRGRVDVLMICNTSRRDGWRDELISSPTASSKAAMLFMSISFVSSGVMVRAKPRNTTRKGTACLRTYMTCGSIDSIPDQNLGMRLETIVFIPDQSLGMRLKTVVFIPDQSLGMRLETIVFIPDQSLGMRQVAMYAFMLHS